MLRVLQEKACVRARPKYICASVSCLAVSHYFAVTVKTSLYHRLEFLLVTTQERNQQHALPQH